MIKSLQNLLSEEEINVIANDYNELWRGRAITDKDHGQVEDLIVSHLSLLAEVKRLQAIEAEHIELCEIMDRARKIAFRDEVKDIKIEGVNA